MAGQPIWYWAVRLIEARVFTTERQVEKKETNRRKYVSTNVTKKLADKVALVTGGSRSIGAAIAKRLATDGAAVALTYSAFPRPPQPSSDMAIPMGSRASSPSLRVPKPATSPARACWPMEVMRPEIGNSKARVINN